MWVLVIAAWFIQPPVNDPRALIVGLFPTAKSCLEAKAAVDANFKAEADQKPGEISTWGTSCVEIKTDKSPKPSPAAQT